MPGDVDGEYVVARKVLLDCLQLLQDQIGALVLVGAQAVYLQTPNQDPGPPAATTDGDLAIDPELLTSDPDVASILGGAGFTTGQNPGRWTSPEGVPIDLMVPASLQPGSARTARLSGQGTQTARRTSGLELTLSNNTTVSVGALDRLDTRTFEIRVATVEALVVAKLIKLEERLEGARPDRVLAKDASDIFRMLRQNDAASIGYELRASAQQELGAGTIERAVSFVARELSSASSSLLALTTDYHSRFEPPAQVGFAFRTLLGRMITAFESGPEE